MSAGPVSAPGMAKAKAAAPHVGNLGGLGLAFYFLWQSLTGLQEDVSEIDDKLDTMVVQIAELQSSVGVVAGMAANTAADLDELEDDVDDLSHIR